MRVVFIQKKKKEKGRERSEEKNEEKVAVGQGIRISKPIFFLFLPLLALFSSSLCCFSKKKVNHTIIIAHQEM
jgi:hypothetical protein